MAKENAAAGKKAAAAAMKKTVKITEKKDASPVAKPPAVLPLRCVGRASDARESHA
jgi:hypothetical protein